VKITQLYQCINNLHTWIPLHLFPNGYALPPLRVGCVLTHRCNLRCSMCFVWKHGTGDHAEKELSTEEWKQVFDQIPSNAIITMTGGEPLVRSDFRELLFYACQKHRVHLVSNATLFNDELAERCVDLAPRSLFGKGLLSLGVSLEGPESVHDKMVQIPGSFKRTTQLLETIAKLKKTRKQRYPLLDLKIVICRDTLHSLTDLYDLANRLDLDIISYQQCSTQESSYGIDQAPHNAISIAPPEIEPIPRDELIPVLKRLKQMSEKGQTVLRFNPEMEFDFFGDRYENRFPLDAFNCAAAWSVMHIGPYGTVFPCFSIPMGNIRVTPLMKIWNGTGYQQFRQKLRKAGIFPGCTGCCVMKPNSQKTTTKRDSK
jgi:MoaA/NifB/PqqE/SkfB family radical SAM enzyme